MKKLNLEQKRIIAIVLNALLMLTVAFVGIYKGVGAINGEIGFNEDKTIYTSILLAPDFWWLLSCFPILISSYYNIMFNAKAQKITMLYNVFLGMAELTSAIVWKGNFWLIAIFAYGIYIVFNQITVDSWEENKGAKSSPFFEKLNSNEFKINLYLLPAVIGVATLLEIIQQTIMGGWGLLIVSDKAWYSQPLNTFFVQIMSLTIGFMASFWFLTKNENNFRYWMVMNAWMFISHLYLLIFVGAHATPTVTTIYIVQQGAFFFSSWTTAWYWKAWRNETTTVKIKVQ